MTQKESLLFANAQIGIIKNRQANLECCKNDILASIRRLEAVASRVIEENWQSEFPALKPMFLSCCEGGCFTENWKPSFFLFGIGERGEASPKSHPEIERIKDFCERMTKLLEFDVWPYADRPSEIRQEAAKK